MDLVQEFDLLTLHRVRGKVLKLCRTPSTRITSAKHKKKIMKRLTSVKNWFISVPIMDLSILRDHFHHSLVETFTWDLFNCPERCFRSCEWDDGLRLLFSQKCSETMYGGILDNKIEGQNDDVLKYEADYLYILRTRLSSRKLQSIFIKLSPLVRAVIVSFCP